MSYVVISDVVFIDVMPSGKAFTVRHRDRGVVIPMFAVHKDSEIWSGSASGDTGSLVLREDIASEKGLGGHEGFSLSTGVGIPLKRHKLPEAPSLMPEERLSAIESRLLACSAQKAPWRVERDLVKSAPHGPEGTVGMWGKEVDAVFAAHAPDDITALIKENRELRAWVTAALKTRERRQK